MRDEQLTILRMLKDGRVNRVDAEKLLRAISGGAMEASPPGAVLEQVESGSMAPEDAVLLLGSTDLLPVEPVASSRWLRIKVERSGKKAVNVRLPLGLIDIGLPLLRKTPLTMNGRPLSAEAIWAAVKAGTTGKLIDVDGEDGEHVEISVE